MQRIRAFILLLVIAMLCNQCTFIGWGVGASIPKRGEPTTADNAQIGERVIVLRERRGPVAAKGYLVARNPNGEMILAPKMPEPGEPPPVNAMAFAPTPTTIVREDRGNHAVTGILIGAAVDVTVLAVVVLTLWAFSRADVGFVPN